MSVMTDFAHFREFLCKTAGKVVAPVVNFLRLHNNALFAAMHEKPAFINATTDHTEISDAVARRGRVVESAPERV